MKDCLAGDVLEGGKRVVQAVVLTLTLFFLSFMKMTDDFELF